jgi:translation initiation factor IF-3
VRVINHEGQQLGVLTLTEALAEADEVGLDLVEIAANATPPVCKIIDYGKYRYQITKKDKEGRKSQHQVKVKELKIKPTTDTHDIEVKVKHAREFILKGNKVRVTCTFRGRELAHPEIGRRSLKQVCDALADIATPEAEARLMGKNLSTVLAPGAKKKPGATA